MPIASESLDAVVSKWIRWVMPSPEKVVAEMVRVTRPGGRVIAIESANPPTERKRASAAAYIKHAAKRRASSLPELSL